MDAEIHENMISRNAARAIVSLCAMLLVSLSAMLVVQCHIVSSYCCHAFANRTLPTIFKPIQISHSWLTDVFHILENSSTCTSTCTSHILSETLRTPPCLLSYAVAGAPGVGGDLGSSTSTPLLSQTRLTN